VGFIASPARPLRPGRRQQVVEQGEGALQPGHVAGLRGRDAGHDLGDARRLRPVELAVLDVDVVDDLGDPAQPGVAQSGALDQDLEGAAVAFVGVFRLEHVEADLAAARPVARGGGELEARLGVDEAPDQPALAMRSI
jgi:hypothetical protein